MEDRRRATATAAGSRLSRRRQPLRRPSRARSAGARCAARARAGAARPPRARSSLSAAPAALARRGAAARPADGAQLACELAAAGVGTRAARAPRRGSTARSARHQPPALADDLAPRRRSAAPTGSPVSSQVPSSRRTQLAVARRARPSAVETVGRRAPTSCADQPVRQRQRDRDAVARHAAPALGEVPEQREQPPVDAVELGDRLRDGQPLRALGEAVDDHRVDLRDSGRARPRSAGRAAASRTLDERGPADSTGSSCGGPSSCQGRTMSPGPEQLGADRVARQDLAREHAVEQEQADVVGAGAGRRSAFPRAGVDRVDDDAELSARGPERGRRSGADRDPGPARAVTRPDGRTRGHSSPRVRQGQYADAGYTAALRSDA